MNTCLHQQNPACKVISIAAARTANAPPLIHNLVHYPGVLDLAELTQAICSNRKIRDSVLAKASEEFGYPLPRVEDAIVLLGRERICALVSTIQRGRACIELRRTPQISTNPPANLCLLPQFQGETT